MKTEKIDFLKNGKNEIILLNFLSDECVVIHKTYVVMRGPSSSLKFSIFCALPHENQNFTMKIKTLFYLIFSSFREGAFRSLLIGYL